MGVTTTFLEWQILQRIGLGTARKLTQKRSEPLRLSSAAIVPSKRPLNKRINNKLALVEAGLRRLFIHTQGTPKRISFEIETQLQLLCQQLEEAVHYQVDNAIPDGPARDDEGDTYPGLKALGDFLHDTSADATPGPQFDIVYGDNQPLFTVLLDGNVKSLFDTVTSCNSMLDDLERGGGDTFISPTSSTNTTPLPSTLFTDRANKILHKILSQFSQCGVSLTHEVLLSVSDHISESDMAPDLPESARLVFDLLLLCCSGAGWQHTQGVPYQERLAITEVADICSELLTWDGSKIFQVLHDKHWGLFRASDIIQPTSSLGQSSLWSIDSLLEKGVFLPVKEARDRWPNLRDPRHTARFTQKEKAAIATTLARGVMDFLDGDEARLEECDGRKIHLLVPDGRRPPEGQVYLPFTKYSDTPMTLEHDDPTRLALAKVLLEIEKGEKIDLGSYASPTLAYVDLIGRASNAAKAGNALYAEAVTNCLNLHTHIEPDEEDPIAALREAMRKEVVTRLQTLKTALSPQAAAARKRASREDDTVDDSVTKKVRSEPPSTQSHPPKAESAPTNGISRDALRPAFLSSTPASAENWLGNLKHIDAEVELERRKRRLKKSAVRVAILDTGVDLELLRPCHDAMDEDDPIDMNSNVTHRADFVNPTAQALDTFGHGTFMAKLVMECAPSAEIMVARVASSTDSLPGSEGHIAKAIIWAGCEQRADIISMSFGFPTNDPSIEAAIEKVKSERSGSVIFLASAGNTSNEDENFPARHPSVISIYATNRHGYFSHSNARSKNQGHGCAKFGTFGEDMPPDVFQRLRDRFPKACQSGSSVATAVAAGISATMLAYIAHLPSLESSVGDQGLPILQRAREKEGMEAVFDRISDTLSEGRFINPVRFWTYKKSHHSRYCAIYECLHDLHVRQPR